MFLIFLPLKGNRKAVSGKRLAVRKRRSGFTLIELIIYIGITAFVVVSVSRVMLTVSGTREKTQVLSSVQQELRIAQDRIAYSIRNALSIDAVNSTFNSNSGALSLNMSGSTMSPTKFSLSGHRIYMREGTSASGALTSTGIIVNRFHVTDLSASNTYGTVKIVMRASDAVTGTGDLTYVDEMVLESSVSLRQ
jgi:Tfp pilus assembly protein PilW